VKLVNEVACQVPLANTLPSALMWVKVPFATTDPPVLKVPEPVTLIVSPAKSPEGAIAVFGLVRLNV